MASSQKFFPAVLVLLLLVVAMEVAPAQAERVCETDSTQFKGICMVGTNCANVCLTEGFTSGKCSGFKRKCMCTKPC
ncbi:defensin [Hordeum vulgare]|uniref:Knottins-like domain-containing protein n=1 Tax=Hordeum vulgare subsp. vulgare TaxID=112509 RepID=A0A8I6WMV7_HORVV|nr:defensin Tk-AMP-D1.1-like [Hordeum vulgare subsp. vulgare]KAE8787661.1 defensin [Hordeum vulgare]